MLKTRRDLLCYGHWNATLECWCWRCAIVTSDTHAYTQTDYMQLYTLSSIMADLWEEIKIPVAEDTRCASSNDIHASQSNTRHAPLAILSQKKSPLNNNVQKRRIRRAVIERATCVCDPRARCSISIGQEQNEGTSYLRVCQQLSALHLWKTKVSKLRLKKITVQSGRAPLFADIKSNEMMQHARRRCDIHRDGVLRFTALGS